MSRHEPVVVGDDRLGLGERLPRHSAVERDLARVPEREMLADPVATRVLAVGLVGEKESVP